MALATNARTAAALPAAASFAELRHEPGEAHKSMSASQPGAVIATTLATIKPRTRGFLRIARHGGGPGAVYVITYHRLGSHGKSIQPKPVPAEGAQALIELLERIGVDFRVREVRDALEDILRLGSANIPDLWLSDEEMLEKGLVES